MVLKDLMMTNFSIVPISSSPAAALAQVAQGAYAVAVNESNQPMGLLTHEDLKSAASGGATSLLQRRVRFRPTVIVGCDVEILDFAQSPATTFFEAGAHGAVLLGDEGFVVGVLPVDVVDEHLGIQNRGEFGKNKYLAFRTMASTSGSGGYAPGTGLEGTINIPSGTVKCLTCGWVNEDMSEIDEDDLPLCQNPNWSSHRLKVV